MHTQSQPETTGDIEEVTSKLPGQILVADDDDAFRESICELIREQGYEVRSVATGPEAIEVIAGGWGDVVVADINMPGNIDLEFFERLRESGSNVGLILVTGYPSFETAKHALNLSVTHYMVKPFEFDELCEQIRIALAQVAVVRRTASIRKQLDQLSNELDLLAHRPVAEGWSGVAGSMDTVMDLVFDRVIGILLDLKQEMSTNTGLDSTRDRDIGVLRSAIAGVAHDDILFHASSEFQSLSPREREVMLSLIAGNRVATISVDLSISQNTVRNHLKSIFSKLGIKSQVELLERFKHGGRRD